MVHTVHFKILNFHYTKNCTSLNTNKTFAMSEHFYSFAYQYGEFVDVIKVK